MLSKSDLFVYLGFIPEFSDGLGWLGYEYNPNLGAGNIDESWWLEQAIRTYRSVITDELSKSPDHVTHVLPLSGGLDSRAILGGLMERLPNSQLVTVTYGIPGAWDYEIAKKISRKFHLQHEEINLLNEEWDLDDMVSAVRDITSPVNVYEWYARQKMYRNFGTDCVYWSGFFGDSISGMDLPKEPCTDKAVAIYEFFHYNRTPNFKDKAFDDAFVEKLNTEFPWQDLEKTKIAYDQQLDFGLRQRQYIYYLARIEPYDVRLPFTNKRWVNFILNTPYFCIYDQHLYKYMLWNNYRSLFELPVKQKSGGSMFASDVMVFFNRGMARIMPKITRKDPYGSHPRTNYINFTEALRHKGHFHDVVYTTLEDLSKRGIYEPAIIKAWWDNHLNKRANNTRLLLNLSSMEILLKAGCF